MMKITIDGSNYKVEVGERLIDIINRIGKELPQVCYHRQLGPIQTCDTCLVEVNGDLVRACATAVADGMRIGTKSARADAGQRQAFDRILANHMLYCTVCDDTAPNPSEAVLAALGSCLSVGIHANAVYRNFRLTKVELELEGERNLMELSAMLTVGRPLRIPCTCQLA
jgi:aerobic-type carbon monoxide dehydrogenase small subunit (CoxS/CutS family)